MRLIRGFRDRSGFARVVTDEGMLPPRNDLHNHSPDGFEWGYGGSGPAQLALAILAAVVERDDIAMTLHQAFKSHVVAGFASDGFILTADFVLGWVHGYCDGQIAFDPLPPHPSAN